MFKEDTLDDVIGSLLSCNNFSTKRKEPEHIWLQPLFIWLPIKLIKKNELSTQHTRKPVSFLFEKTYLSPFPAFDVKHRSKPVSADAVYSDIPAVYNGSTYAQIV